LLTIYSTLCNARFIEIGQDLPKLLTEVYWHVFYGVYVGVYTGAVEFVV